MGGAGLKFLIREPEGAEEFEEIARLQEVVWGFEPEGIAHTGRAKAEITKERFDKLEFQ